MTMRRGNGFCRRISMAASTGCTCQFVGAEVTEGQPLADLYSPTLLQAEREFRQLTGELQQRTALRLRQLGLTSAQIEALPRKDPNALTSQILSPSSGTVVAKLSSKGSTSGKGRSCSNSPTSRRCGSSSRPTNKICRGSNSGKRWT